MAYGFLTLPMFNFRVVYDVDLCLESDQGRGSLHRVRYELWLTAQSQIRVWVAQNQIRVVAHSVECQIRVAAQ